MAASAFSGTGLVFWEKADHDEMKPTAQAYTQPTPADRPKE
jgi:hypothetical protein